MLTYKQIQELKKQWPIAEESNAKAIVRLYDDKARWECYLLGMNSNNTDQVVCLIFSLENTQGTFELGSMYDLKILQATGVEKDTEFVPRSIEEIMKQKSHHDTITD